MEDHRISIKYLESRTLKELIQLNTYLMKRHTFHVNYEESNKLQVIVALMDAIDGLILTMLVNCDPKEFNTHIGY